MKKKFFIVSVLLLTAASRLSAAQTEFYVSPAGRDTNPGTKTAPFQTIQKAQEAVRAVPAAMKGDIVVYLRGGVYPLARTLEFSEEDSGKNGGSIIYANYPGETPEISGGRKVTGWQPVTVNGIRLVKAKVPADITDFRQFYVNGEKAARTKGSHGFSGIGYDDDPAQNMANNAGGTDTDGIIVRSADLGITHFTNPDTMEVSYQSDWVNEIVPVKDIRDLGNGKSAIVFVQPYFNMLLGSGGQWDAKFDSEFFLENTLDLLSRPGQWYFDKKAHELFYYPRAGEDMRKAEAVVPVLERLVAIQGQAFFPGTSAPKVAGLQFHGITFEYSNWTWPSEHSYQSWDNLVMEPGAGPTWEDNPTNVIEVQGAVNVSNATGLVFERNRFRFLGADGLDFNNGVLNSRITGNYFGDIASAALRVGMANHLAIQPELGEETCKNITINDNYVTRAASDYWNTAAVVDRFTENTQFLHNEITDVSYDGVNFSNGSSGTNDTAKNNKINFNKITDTQTKERLYDGAAIYVNGAEINDDITGKAAICSQIKGNFLSNPPNPQTHNHTAIYPDQASTHRAITDNVIEYGVDKFVNFWQDSIRDNVADNNYTTTTEKENGDGAKYNTISNTHVSPDANWPAEVRAIKANAGIAPAFRDIIPFVRVSGTVFGSDVREAAKLFDKKEETDFTSTASGPAFAGMDFGAGKAKRITLIRFKDRPGFAASLQGGKFQGSNTSATEGFVDLYTIGTTFNNHWHAVRIGKRTAYRYVRYVAPAGVESSLAEAEFYTTPGLSSASHEYTLPEPRDKAAPVAAPSAAVPNGTGDLLLWVQAEDATDRNAGGAVNVWKDKSSYGYDLVSDSIFPIKYVPDAANGKPALRFSGASAVLGVSFDNKELIPSYTLQFVIKPAVVQKYNTHIGVGGGASFATDELGQIYIGPAPESDKRLDSTRFPSLGPGALEVGKWQEFVYVQDGATAKFFKNGKLLAAGSVQAVKDPLWGLDLSSVWGEGSSIHGDVAEIRLYKKALTEEERSALTKAALAEYNLSGD